MQILKNTGTDLRKKDWSENCIWIRMLKYEWAKETQEVWRLEEDLYRDTVFTDYLQVTLYSEYRAKEAVAGTWDFKTVGK